MIKYRFVISPNSKARLDNSRSLICPSSVLQLNLNKYGLNSAYNNVNNYGVNPLVNPVLPVSGAVSPVAPVASQVTTTSVNGLPVSTSVNTAALNNGLGLPVNNGLYNNNQYSNLNSHLNYNGINNGIYGDNVYDNGFNFPYRSFLNLVPAPAPGNSKTDLDSLLMSNFSESEIQTTNSIFCSSIHSSPPSPPSTRPSLQKFASAACLCSR